MKAKPEPTAGTGLWIRVAANLSRRKVTWRLTESLLAQFPIPAGAPRSLMQKAAMGFLQELWGNIAEHTTDGVIVHLPDAQLEQWAGWDGEPGVFAAWLRSAHLDADSGRVNEWEEFAGALQNKRANDAERQRTKRERDRVARESMGGGTRRPVATTTDADPSRFRIESASDPTPVTAAADAPPPRASLSLEEVGDLARECTIAANKGMSENPKIDGIYNPIMAGRGDSTEFVTYLAAEGVRGAVHWEFVQRCVYTIAKSYTPEKLGDHIKSMTFFRERTLAMWRRAVAKAQAEKAGPYKELPVGGRKTGSERAARSVAGAMAAAAAVGLSDD